MPYEEVLDLLCVNLPFVLEVKHLEALEVVKRRVGRVKLDSEQLCFALMIEVHAPKTNEQVSCLRIEEQVLPHPRSFSHLQRCLLG